MFLLAGSEILTSRPSTPKWPLDMLDPATAVYSPASDRRTDGTTRRCTNLSELILYLQEKVNPEGEQLISSMCFHHICSIKKCERLHLSDISSSWPSFIHITWTFGSETSHSKVALFFSVIFRSFRCLVNSTTRAARKNREINKTVSINMFDLNIESISCLFANSVLRYVYWKVQSQSPSTVSLKHNKMDAWTQRPLQYRAKILFLWFSRLFKVIVVVEEILGDCF